MRRIVSSDAAALAKLYACEEVNRYLDWSGPKTEIEAVAAIGFFDQQYRAARNVRWGVVLHGSEDVIGTVLLSNFRRAAIADLGYDLRPDYWGKGIMREALEKLLSFAFLELGLLRIQAYVRPENTASARLLEKLGFELEGLLKQAGYHDTQEGFYDIQLYARINN